MSLYRFFLEKQILAKLTDAQPFALELSSDDAQHARVLRLQPGERIAVIDGVQNYYVCEVVTSDAQGLYVRISQAQDADAPGMSAPPFEVSLVAGVGKQGKLDDVIRAATELGVARFMPFLSSRTVVKLDAKKSATRADRWRAIAKSAAMQSGALRVPQVDLPSALTSVAPDLKDFDAVVVFWEEAPQTSSLKAALADARAKIANRIETATPSAEAAPSTFVEPFAGDFRPIRVACVVGPEGGLSQSEVEMLLAANSNAHLASMGPSILRTETAGVVACALCIYELGGLGAGGLQIATNKAVSEV